MISQKKAPGIAASVWRFPLERPFIFQFTAFEGAFQVKCPHRSPKDPSGSFHVTELTVHSLCILILSVKNDHRKRCHQNILFYEHSMYTRHRIVSLISAKKKKICASWQSPCCA